MPVTEITPESQLERAKAEGWKYDGSMATEGEVLDLIFGLVRVTKPDTAVETGTFWGHGAEAISEALRLNERGNLWTVERSEKFDYKPRDRVTYVQADSIEWSANDAPAEINFAFVDCSSDYHDRVEVFKNLWPRMTPGGLICVHDIFFLGADFLNELCEVAERPPGLVLQALNGFAVWTCA